MGAVTQNKQTREEFLEWLLLDKRTRTIHSLPTTEKDFAELKGVTARTLYRWKHDEEFQERLEQRKVKVGGKLLPNAAVTAKIGRGKPAKDARTARDLEPPPVAGEADDPAYDVPTADKAELEYRKVRTYLAELALAGDGKALDLYYKHYGHVFVAAENAARESSFADLDDDELMDEILESLGVDRVAAWLHSQMSDAG